MTPISAICYFIKVIDMDELETKLIEVEEEREEDRLQKGLRILAQIMARQILRSRTNGETAPEPATSTVDEEA